MMRFGCFVAMCLWLALASVLLGSIVPVATGAVFIASGIVYRGLRSDWPLY